jgi:hypothetical protein
MRRGFFVALIAAVPLIFGTASASALTLPLPGGLTGITDLLSPKAPVVGTVVSTDPANGTFVANASAINPFAFLNIFGGTSTPATSQVTISTNSNTLMLVNGQPGAVSNLGAGEHFIGLFDGLPTDSVQTLTANPADFILAHGTATGTASKQLYAFVGTVTGVDTSAGTVTVTVSNSFPSGLVAANTSASFTVGQQTLILGGASSGSPVSGLGGSLGDVATGDIVAGGMIGTSGETLSQVEAQPLSVLLDLPAPSGSSTSAAKARAKSKALHEALALLRGKSLRSTKHHHNRHHGRHHG